MKQLSYQQAHNMIDLLTEQEITQIFKAGLDYLNTMGVSSSANPDGFFYNVQEQLAVNMILDPNATIPDELYSDVEKLVNNRETMSCDRSDKELWLEANEYKNQTY